MSINRLKSQIAPIETLRVKYSGYFDKILENFSDKVSGIDSIETTEKLNQFIFLNHEVKFEILWENKWWYENEIKIQIRIERAFDKKSKKERTEQERIFDIKSSVQFTVDKLSNVKIVDRIYTMDEEELVEMLLIQICKSIGLEISN